jgi:hypothetical protein
VLVLYGVVTELWLQALGCQRCLPIVYYSENCHGNLWYEHVIKPRRRLRQIEARLAEIGSGGSTDVTCELVPAGDAAREAWEQRTKGTSH